MPTSPPDDLPFEAFTGHEDAHYYFSMDGSTDDAVAMLRRRVADGSWARAPYDHAHLIRWLKQRRELDPAVVRGLNVDLATAIMGSSEGFSEGIQDALRVLFGAMADDGEAKRDAEPVVAWLVERAGPGEARLVADLVQQAYERLGAGLWRTPPVLRPLARWLVERGSAELRSPHRVLLLGKFARLIADDGDDLVVPVLRLLVRRRDVWGYLDEASRTRLWQHLDAHLDLGASASLAIDLAGCLGAYGTAVVFLPGREISRARAAVVSGLLRGAFDDGLSRELWPWAIAGAAPPDDEVARAPLAVLALALDQLSYRLSGRPARERMGDQEVDGSLLAPRPEWIAALVRAYLGGAGGMARIMGDAGLRNRMVMVAGYTNQSAAVFGVELRRWLQAQEKRPEHALALRVLGGGVVGIGRATAAVRALATGQLAGTPAAVEIPEEFRSHLRGVLHAPWAEFVYGVSPADLFGAARSVEFVALDGENKVRADGEVLRVDSGYPRLLATSIWPTEERLALLTLYVIHELVHLQQGIGEKSVVTRLRETGGETTLMHLDLAADHAAAMLAALGVVRWSLDWLKDLQGRSLADFPVGPTHASGSRARKSARLVGVRVDHLVRRHRLVPVARLSEGYAFAEFGAAAGPFLVFVSGPPVALCLSRNINAEQAQVLTAAADEEHAGASGLGRVDAVLRAVLGVGEP